LLIIATTSGVVTSRALMGNAAVFVVQPFVLRSYLELLTYAMMGVILGALAAVFIRIFYFVAEVFRASGLPAWMRLMIGLALVGLIAIPFPENLSDGYPIIDRSLA